MHPCLVKFSNENLNNVCEVGFNICWDIVDFVRSADRNLRIII